MIVASNFLTGALLTWAMPIGLLVGASLWVAQRLATWPGVGLIVVVALLAGMPYVGSNLGGGMTLMLATDIRIAASHATFGLAEVKRGVIPGNGGTQRILRQVPYAIAMEMLVTGDSIDAETAARWGLVNKVVAADRLLGVAHDYARRIAANAPLAVQAAKELALRSRDLDLASGLRLEQVMNRMLMATEDAREGPAAFAAKRPAAFKGR
jgi:enoyl-CoA hydratase/carnithine racemase